MIIKNNQLKLFKYLIFVNFYLARADEIVKDLKDRYTDVLSVTELEDKFYNVLCKCNTKEELEEEKRTN